MASQKLAPLVVIVGETASGKTQLALELAERFNGEIIAADSWTVYKGFDIGTAKPSPAESRAVPHHLLDVADPRQGFNAPRFQRLALAAIENILARDKLPILVGGTGLYVDSVLYNYNFLPAPSPQLRAKLSKLSVAELLKRIEELGLDITGIDTRNKRRLIRVLENNGRRPTKQPLRSNTLIIGCRLDRETLRKNICKRVDAMLAAGLEDEVSSLAKQYGWKVEPMQGIGYREWQNYFNGTQNLDQTRDRIVANTLSILAKKQRTWFKRNKSIHWVNKQSEAVDLVTTFLNN